MRSHQIVSEVWKNGLTSDKHPDLSSSLHHQHIETALTDQTDSSVDFVQNNLAL